MLMTPNPHQTEWARLAKAAYGRGRNDIGNMYAGAATIDERPIDIHTFDALQSAYREWLIDNTLRLPCA